MTVINPSLVYFTNFISEILGQFFSDESLKYDGYDGSSNNSIGYSAKFSHNEREYNMNIYIRHCQCIENEINFSQKTLCPEIDKIIDDNKDKIIDKLYYCWKEIMTESKPFFSGRYFAEIIIQNSEQKS